jgi:CDP-glycerol glycerophosphotransferase (TagB/SpsB family)
MEMQRGFEGKQIWATGYSQMDVLFRAPPLGPLLEELSTRKVVLYAPTFNALLSSAYMLGEQLIDLIRGKRSDLTVIIKPHPDLCDKSNYIFHTWRTLAQREPHVYLISRPSANIMPYLRVADLLISDASSVMYAFLALDRPVILVTNPDSRHDPSYDPDGIEWRWRDFGEEITDVKQLPAAVARALDEPQRHARQRAYYRAQLFGDLTDGRAADRIAAHISALT